MKIVLLCLFLSGCTETPHLYLDTGGDSELPHQGGDSLRYDHRRDWPDSYRISHRIPHNQELTWLL